MKNINTKILHREKDVHKGNFGHVFVLAGSKGLTGAAYLCAQAALLSGAGLVTLGIPESLNVILARKLTEVMTKPLPETKQGSLSLQAYEEIKRFSQKADVLAIGPGLSQNPQTQQLIRKVVKKIKKPMVIDADGLNALVGNLDILKVNKNTKVITPHSGEMARLFRELGLTKEKIQKNRLRVAKQIACMYNMVTILKGYKTVVADFNNKTYINTTGNPGMAKAGTGDVLTGIAAGLLAQTENAFEAAKLAVYFHGKAGDIAAGEKGQLSLRASDILDFLPRVLKKI
ncbi:MAG: NAD(P)H-hydrate dehydratase [Candidatus Omnitrophota bacterium]